MNTLKVLNEATIILEKGDEHVDIYTYIDLSMSHTVQFVVSWTTAVSQAVTVGRVLTPLAPLITFLLDIYINKGLSQTRRVLYLYLIPIIRLFAVY